MVLQRGIPSQIISSQPLVSYIPSVRAFSLRPYCQETKGGQSRALEGVGGMENSVRVVHARDLTAQLARGSYMGNDCA